MIFQRLGVFFKYFLPGILLLTISFCTNSDNIIPVLSSLSPPDKVSHMPSFTLTAVGSGFAAGSEIIFNGTSKTTNFISSTEISCIIDKNDISISLYSDDNLIYSKLQNNNIPVLIRNPGGEESETIFFSIKDNHSFITPLKLSEEHSTSYNPAITTDPDGNIYIIYDRYDRNVNGYYVSVISSNDKGESWTEFIDIFTSLERSYNTRIASGPDGKLYVTFFNAKLYFSYSEDSGNTWNTPKELTPNANSPLESEIEIDKNGDINIIWLQRDGFNYKAIYFMRSEDKGDSFSQPVIVSAGWKNYSSIYNPSFAIDNNNGIFVTWTAWPIGGSRYSYVYFNYSHDNGVTWQSEDKYFGVCSSSELSVDPEGNIDLALSSSYLPFQNQIVYYKSVDNGVSWENYVPVTSASSDYYPIIRTDSAGNRNIIFKRGNYYYFTRSFNGGVTWTDPIFVTDKTSYRFDRGKLIDMVLDNEGNIFIVSEYDNIGLLYFTKNN